MPVVAASPPTVASRTPLPSPPPPGSDLAKGRALPVVAASPHTAACRCDQESRQRERGGPRERGEDAVEIIIKTERIWIDGAVRFGSARLRGVSFFKEKVRFTPVLLRLTETPLPRT